MSINFISFPRSGHHLLIGRFLKYFSKDAKFDVNLTGLGEKGFCKVGKFGYCEYYRHCHKVPCPEIGIVAQKNHDLDLKIVKNNEDKYIIQIRYPISSIVSWFELEVRDFGLENTNKSWESFAIEKADFWNKFAKKWLLDGVDNRAVVHYEDLIEDPFGEFKKTLSFVALEDLNVELAFDSVRWMKIRPSRNVKDFNFYNEMFFDKLKMRMDDVYKKVLAKYARRIKT